MKTIIPEVIKELEKIQVIIKGEDLRSPREIRENSLLELRRDISRIFPEVGGGSVGCKYWTVDGFSTEEELEAKREKEDERK